MKQLTDNQQSKPSVVTIGNFDGIHLGHQNIIKQLIQHAKQHTLLTTVIIFEPQPQEFFLNSEAPARLTNFTEKLFYLENLGVDQVCVIAFDSDIQKLSAQNFIQQYLINTANAKHVIVGDDFKFGADRQGDFALLQQQNTFTAQNTETVLIADKRVSSSRIRVALHNSDFNVAEKLLGRRYAMRGKVIHGDQNGRKLAAPTANLDPQRLVLPFTGVFAVTIHGLDKPYHGVANLGTRPTLDGIRTLLETHIFDFDTDIYGRTIEVEFQHKIRDEQKFANFAELKQHIQQDIESARQWHQRQIC
jgi:riboflavin kinase/FMN adenylyltransferase